MYAAEKPTAYIYFSSIIHILPFPFLNLCMIFFSNLDMYDCEIPSRSATSFCVFFFSIRIIQSKSHTYNQLFSAVKFIQSTNQKFSLRFIFQIFINRIFFRSQKYPTKAARFHPSQRSKVRRWTPPSLSCYYALSTLKFHFQYIGMRMLQV